MTTCTYVWMCVCACVRACVCTYHSPDAHLRLYDEAVVKDGVDGTADDTHR